MSDHRLFKRSEHELRRLTEDAVNRECDLGAKGLWFCVEQVEAQGHPVERLKVWATLHFLPAGSPFCCGEPECHLGLTRRREAINDRVRRAMELRQPVTVEFGWRVAVRYHEGVRFNKAP